MSKTKFSRSALVILLAMSLVFGMGTTAFGAGADVFTDIDRNHWAYEYVDDVVWREIFNGTSKTTFSPDQNMTRAMFVTALNNMHLANASTGNYLDSGFSDVPQGQYYTGAVKWASENNIVSGVGDGKFAPHEPITREQMASIIARYAAYDYIFLPDKVNSVTFKDDASISSYAKTAVYNCQKSGIISGTGDNSFDPQGLATRAQVAVMLSKLREVKGGDSGEEFIVRFDSMGGSEVKSQTVVAGESLKSFDEPTRHGYKFDGWYTTEDYDSNEFDVRRAVYQSMTLYAKWAKKETSSDIEELTSATWDGNNLLAEYTKDVGGDYTGDVTLFLPIDEIKDVPIARQKVELSFDVKIDSISIKNSINISSSIDGKDLELDLRNYSYTDGDTISVITTDNAEYVIKLQKAAQWDISVTGGSSPLVEIKESSGSTWKPHTDTILVSGVGSTMDIRTNDVPTAITVTTNDPDFDATIAPGSFIYDGTTYYEFTTTKTASGYIYELEFTF